jgi:hypothetical protein
MTTLQRFPVSLNELFERCIPVPFSGCWIWNGTIAHDGYGRVPSGRRGVSIPAHRLAFEYAKGPIQDGLQIDHLCRIKGCINPDHLEAVTASMNVLRGLVPTTASKHMKAVRARLTAIPRTHCPRGHELTAENVILERQHRDGSITRKCRECKRTAFRIWQQAGRRKK